ncbi:hypothetical protein OOU_Y34scaffold01112g6 [Pyricularia oryzae Y34]|uniref:Uncharacterized protein n=1 Tax=Pyricularia oryzae (strain Y34) TaxID=1143189 RepID=A0AA97NLU1_PYRO3|nr:hypothetical protein OOU_Y34scaffold01112g6 [Pyricularia oryzae Y34]
MYKLLFRYVYRIFFIINNNIRYALLVGAVLCKSIGLYGRGEIRTPGSRALYKITLSID